MEITGLLNLRLLLFVFCLVVITGCHNSNDSDSTETIVTPESHDVHCPP